MRGKRFSVAFRATVLIFTVTLFVMRSWAASETVLYSFGNGTDGAYPIAGLIFDTAGNLYGTTLFGGSYGNGTVFELTPQAGGGWTENVLYSFGNGADAANPQAGLVFDAAGNLYGTTYSGGSYGNGTVFELTTKAGGGWTEQVIYSFGNGTDGAGPSAGLIFDAAGNLYGTTFYGGTYGGGTVFELTPQAGRGWTEQVLYSFCSQANCADGFYANTGLVFDAAGNLYGTTYQGGDYFEGINDGGTVFELTPQAGGWTEKVLYSFGNGTDGAGPNGSLIFDGVGNLYGPTSYGGTGWCSGLSRRECGTVFELTPQAGGGWTENVLHTFSHNPTLGIYDGSWPEGSLIFDAAGNLYGTTLFGGFHGGKRGHGAVFKLTPKAGGGWKEKVLHSFNYNSAHGIYDGISPYAGLVFDAHGNLYGTTKGGGAYASGTVFEITP
jgi:uncharacterized repeat protein (TIGR03803 family)